MPAIEGDQQEAMKRLIELRRHIEKLEAQPGHARQLVLRRDYNARLRAYRQALGILAGGGFLDFIFGTKNTKTEVQKVPVGNPDWRVNGGLPNLWYTPLPETPELPSPASSSPTAREDTEEGEKAREEKPELSSELSSPEAKKKAEEEEAKKAKRDAQSKFKTDVIPAQFTATTIEFLKLDNNRVAHHYYEHNPPAQIYRILPITGRQWSMLGDDMDNDDDRRLRDNKKEWLRFDKYCPYMIINKSNKLWKIRVGFHLKDKSSEKMVQDCNAWFEAAKPFSTESNQHGYAEEPQFILYEDDKPQWALDILRRHR